MAYLELVLDEEKWIYISLNNMKVLQYLQKHSNYNIFMCRKNDLLFVILVFIFVSCDQLPEYSSVEDIPDYYPSYLEGRIEKINEAIAESEGNYDSFVWITDIHWEQDLNTRHSPAMIRYITERTGIDKILNGGDTGNANNICQNAIDMLRGALGSDRVYTVTGNHEITDASKYEKPFDRVAKTLRGHNRDIVYGDDDRSYFYFDDNAHKTRFIGLSVFGLYRNGGCESALNEQQLEWFEKVALNVVNDWSVVVFAHTMYVMNGSTGKLQESPAGASGFIRAIDNYQGKGTIACVLLGHTHRDRMHIGETGVPYIISACDRHSTYHGDINVTRVPGTLSEQHFEVVVIDKTHKKVRLFSIGGKTRDGYDNEPGKEVDERVVYYE